MGFAVTLYSFSKRNNSTARPSGGQSFSCTIKQASGTVYPTILVDIGLGTAPAYNYVYIPAFSRYYWIVEHINRGPVWELKLKVDPLASWKSQIGNTNLYVLRSSEEYDGNITDMVYPASTACTITNVVTTQLFSNSVTAEDFHPPVQGCFVCGIVSKDANVGALKYYAIPDVSFTNMCTNLLSDSFFSDSAFDLEGAGMAIKKSFVNPLQYIKSCYYLPVASSAMGGSSANVIVYNWDTAVSGVSLGTYTPYSVFNKSIHVDNHPQISRGRYLNFPPYTIYWLSAPPFGTIQIDGTLIRDSSYLNLKVILDHFTGLGTLYVSNDNGTIINSLSAQVGVPINMSQVTRDYLGAGTSTVGGLASVGAGIMSGDWFGAIGSAFSGIGNAAQSVVPRVQSTGTQGSFSSLYGTVKLFEQFFTVADEDLSHNGRPLCKIRKPSALGGFIKVLDGDIAAPATDAELEMIRGYLEGGFYYE
jgi:hypothetical protein